MRGDRDCCHDLLGPHWGTESIDVPNCCHSHAEDLPANSQVYEGVVKDAPLPGWTAQTGQANALPVEICPMCLGEIGPGELHEHTVIPKGHNGERTLTKEGVVVHRHPGDPIPYEQ